MLFFQQKIQLRTLPNISCDSVYHIEYAFFVIKVAFDIERVGKGHKHFLSVVSLFDRLDGSLSFFVLIKCEPELTEWLPKGCEFILAALLDLVEILGAKLFEVEFLAHYKLNNANAVDDDIKII